MSDLRKPSSTPEPELIPHLTAEAVECFNYAAWQNAVPLLRSVIVENPTPDTISSLTVELTASPEFVQSKRWTIDRVGSGESLSLSDVDLELDGEYLDRIDEAVRGSLKLRLMARGETLSEFSQPLRVLARSEWGGMGSMAELLPAFVTPNDPALAPLLKAASDVLMTHGQSPGLDGYQSSDRNRAYLLAASLWSAVAARSLTYANPPSSFERVGQKTRRVSTILADGLATCLDSTLLFASGLEAIGLNAVLVMTEGHCFVGVWLIENTLQKLVEPDCSELRKAIAAKELVVFETTLITHRPTEPFDVAIEVANDKLSEASEHEFVAAIDVSRARMAQVRPLASYGQRNSQTEKPADAGPLPLPQTPGFDQLPAEPTEERPQTPAGRIDRWQRKLLDLSLRNRLLNFRPTKQTVPVLCPNVSLLEDRLADGNRMRMVSLKDENTVADRDAALHQKRTQKDLDIEFATEALSRGEIACPIEGRDLDVRLTALYRKAKSDLSEGGSNTLYLAVGFLRWKQAPTDEKTYRAPLLLVPVKLTRRSASSPYYVTNHEDDVRFNATLLQLLKKDFDCDLTSMESDLPTDDSGVDVPRVLDRMRRAVRDIPGFEVVEDAAIASFSFAKYLMWKDLVERVGQLEKNRVVRHLVNEPDKAFNSEGTGPMPRPHEIDVRYKPSEIVHPLPADSSQLAAVMAASEGHDMVIVGPPGTGKSQTIANVIAQCLSVGKTILFVAEKTAALDVVHRRLREHGLGDCCIELHSNKAERKRFLEQLERSWKNRGQSDEGEWFQIGQRLRLRRDELNAYVAAVHTQHPNGWTAYQAMGRCVLGRGQAAPELTWTQATTHDREEYEALRSTVDVLAQAFGALPEGKQLSRVRVAEWSMSWESQLLDACRQLEESAGQMRQAIGRCESDLGVSLGGDMTPSQLPAFYRLAQALTRPQLPPKELLDYSDLEVLQKELAERGGLLTARKQAEQQLEEAVSHFLSKLGVAPSASTPDTMRRSLYRLANELIKADLPESDLVFHNEFDRLPELLKERCELLQIRGDAEEAIESRSFNRTLLTRLDLSAIEKAWSAASASFWPLSILKKRGVERKLKSFAESGAVPDPDLDLPLLRDHQDVIQGLSDNLGRLALSGELAATVEVNPQSIDQKLETAARLREAIVAAGAAINDAATACNSDLEPLVTAARQLYPPSRELESVRVRLRDGLAGLGLPPELQELVEEDASALDSERETAKQIRDLVQALATDDEACGSSVKSLAETPAADRCEIAAKCCRSAKAFQAAWQEYTRQAGMSPVAKDSEELTGDAVNQAQSVLRGRTQLKQWAAWIGARAAAQACGLEAFVKAIELEELTPNEAVDRFELAYARWWLQLAIDGSDTLRTFQRHLHEGAIEDFRQLDGLARRAAPLQVRQKVVHDLPTADKVPRKSELGLLRHQMGLKRPSRSIREVIEKMPKAFGKLAPCLMMSPLSIAQYLPAGQAQFDVVVFDEASQIATWDAIGAIARGKQTIIVGDPKQLPPTNFFGRTDSDEDDEEIDDFDKDLESILDEAQASGLPTLQLNWHYRSRHESLIAFSNWNYYDNDLVTFPAANSEERGVAFNHVKSGVYDRGKSRTNRQEAEAIVADAVAKMKRCLGKPETDRLTYGVVTFNQQQQSLILDLFDQARRDDPGLEWFFDDESRVEPTMVRNLESVQGDERDVMYFSITFGKDNAGKFGSNFGAINKDGGERRLNVAVTRAREALNVYSSFLPEEIKTDGLKGRGVGDLKAFLDYAHRGVDAIAGRIKGSIGGFDSPFEEAVAEALAARGWEVEPQVGVSGFRIDLGVVDPDLPGAYLSGVECDGATYHRSAVARDRDKTRQQVLENLGWKIVRVWSPDWWYDAESAIEEVHKQLSVELDRRRSQRLAEEDELNAIDAACDDSDAELRTAAITPLEAGEAHDSDFEKSISDALHAAGWKLEAQVAVLQYRIDLGVLHPNRPGEYLAGIECDGAAYHRSPLARDNDKIRQQEIEEIGWKIFRVWSTDWLEDNAATMQRINQQLQDLLAAEGNATHRLNSGSVTTPNSGDFGTDLDAVSLDSGNSIENQQDEDEPCLGLDQSNRPKLVAKESKAVVPKAFYRQAELPDSTNDQPAFFDEDQSDTIERLAKTVLETEGPVRDDVLCKRIARAYGFGRTGSRIKERVLALLEEVDVTNESVGAFLWPADSCRSSLPFRYDPPGSESRSLNEVPIEELVGLIQSRPDLSKDEDPALAFAREIGLSRLARSARERLEEAIERASGGS